MRRSQNTGLTCASVIGMKLVFLEDKLIVNILDIWQVEVRFRYEQRRLGGIHLCMPSQCSSNQNHRRDPRSEPRRRKRRPKQLFVHPSPPDNPAALPNTMTNLYKRITF